MYSLIQTDRQRAAAVGEIAFVVLCVLFAEWAIIPLFGKNMRIGIIPVALVFIGALLSHWLRRETPRALGLRVDNFLQCLRLLLAPMFYAGIALGAIGSITARLGFGTPRSLQSLWTPAWLLLWAFMQQYALQAVINRRAQILWGRGTRSVAFVGGIFALLHLPNPWLMLATFLAGLLWAAVYQRVPNVFALTISHCIMTIVLLATVPSAALHGMRVGFNYF